MSKKIALGTKKLVLDVKVGKGALIKTVADAKRLSKIMIDIGKHNDMEVICVLTNMDIPLGNNIGNSLEVEEAIEILKENKKGPLKDLCIELSSHMVALGLNISYELAKEKVIKNLENGTAYDKFLEIIKEQNGFIEELPKSKNKYDIKSISEGYLINIDAYKLGLLSMSLGAGRKNKEDKIDYTAGIVIHKNINDYINKDDIIMTLYTSKQITTIDNTIFKISNDRVNDNNLIIDIIK